MAVAAVDSYMHWMVCSRLSHVRREDSLPAALAKHPVPFSELAELAEAVVAERRGAGRKIRPWVQVKASLQDQLLKETFQSYEQISNAFALAGIKKGWSGVSDLIGIPSDEIKVGLGYVVHRRNQIVHEGDIERASRPRRLRHNEINHDEVSSCVDWLEELVAAIEEVVKAQS